MKRKGLLAISPFFFFLFFYIISSLIAGDFKSTPIVVAFLFSSVYALFVTPNHSLTEKIKIFTKGTADPSLIFMILIFILAGTFSSSASAMGCVSNTVNFILTVLPARFILASIFIAGCFLSFGTGSGIGTIVALGPIAAGVAEQTGANMPLTLSVVVCGAMFGDNLSFISDTTVVATQSQGCHLNDKFKVNIFIALPAAIAVCILYVFLGKEINDVDVPSTYNVIKIIPYIIVIICSLLGMNVLVTLLSGSLICGIMGIVMRDFNFYGWLGAMASGIENMSLFITIIMLATGLIAMIQYNGGVKYVVDKCTKFVRGTKSAEAMICVLTALVCACTANNTVTIMSVGGIVKDLSEKFNVDKRKACSIMDISSCIVQETIPYSTHLLPAAAFGGVATIEMLPYVFYPYALVICLIFAIVFGLPKLTRKPLADSVGE